MSFKPLPPATHAERGDRLREILNACNWNVAQAAKRAGFSRQQTFRLIKRYGIVRPSSAPQAHVGSWSEQGL